jgi:EpsI family protein
LRLTGFAVHRDGLFFSTTVGDFAVADTCSGVRYLMASVTAGTLFAYLKLRSLRYRLSLVAVSIIAPILANGLRAYLVVVIAHVSGMKLAVGVDHVFYGTIFFAVVMLIVFWIGARWSLREPRVATAGSGAAPLSPPNALQRYGLLVATGIVLLAGPMIARSMANTTAVALALTVPSRAGTWQRLPQLESRWVPAFSREAEILRADYGPGGGAPSQDSSVALSLIQFPAEQQGAELVGSTQNLVDAALWRPVSERSIHNAAGAPFVERVYASDGSARRLTVWYTYWVAGRASANRYAVTAWSLYERVFGTNRAPVLIALLQADHGAGASDRVSAVAHEFAAFSACLERPDAGSAPPDCLP